MPPLVLTSEPANGKRLVNTRARNRRGKQARLTSVAAAGREAVGDTVFKTVNGVLG